jgi:hypothetical protein
VSRLIVERRELWGRDRFRRYQLVLDGQPSGSVGHRDHEVIEVARGTHRLQARMDHFESDVITFTVPDDDDVYLELRAKILVTTGVAASTVAWSALEFRFIDAPEFPTHSKGLGRLADALQVAALLASTAGLSVRGFGGHTQAHHATAFIALAVVAILAAMIVREYSRPRRSRGHKRSA